MRIGPLEVIIILLVVILVAVVMRIARMGVRVTNSGSRSSAPGRRHAARRSSPKQNYAWLTGTAFVVAGLLLFTAGVNLFRWVVWSYSGAFIAIVVGLTIIFFSRRR